MPGLDENALQYREIVRLQAEVEELAAALRASEARAEKAERERDAYREGFTVVPSPVVIVCRCPEHAPEVGGIAEQTDP